MKFAKQQKLVWMAATVVAVVFVAGQPADASFLLRLTDLTSGGEEQIIMDDAALGDVSDGGFVTTTADMAGTREGAVMYLGSVGTFNFVMTTGISDPVIGSDVNKRMDLVSLMVSGGDGLLQIELTDTDFQFTRGSGTTHLTSSIGGTTDGIVTAQSFVDLGNEEFGTEITPGLQGEFGSDSNSWVQNKSFNGFAMTSFNLAPQQQFSMTQRVTVQHFNNGGGDETTSFDIMTEVHTPEPSAIVMWGIGMACFGLYNTRRRRRE